MDYFFKCYIFFAETYTFLCFFLNYYFRVITASVEGCLRGGRKILALERP